MACAEDNGSSTIGYLRLISGGKRYVYDQTTNACSQIPRIVDLVLDDFLAHGANEVRQRYQHKIREEALCSALEYLDELTAHYGMFQPPPKIGLSGFLSSGDLAEILASPCRQLTLNISEQCNQRCTYCIYSGNYPGERSHRSRAMTWPVARKSIDHLISRSRENVNSKLNFYGGEPLLRWDLVKRCINYARNSAVGQRLKITLNSNLTLLNDEIAHFLRNHDVHVSTSLDGSQAAHDSARVFAGGGGTHQTVIQQLWKLIDLDPDYCRRRLIIKCTVDSTRDIVDLFDYFSQGPLKDLEVTLNPLREPDGAGATSPSKDQSARRRQSDQLLTGYLDSVRAKKPVNHRLFQRIFPAVFSRIAQRLLKLNCGEEIMRRLCIPSVSGIFVSADGRLFTCENFSYPENCIGSVQTGVDTEQVRALLATYVGFCEEMCRQCWAARLCSQCFVHTLDRGRISKERMQENCVRERKSIAKEFEAFLYLWENEPAWFRDNEFSLHSAVLSFAKTSAALK